MLGCFQKVCNIFGNIAYRNSYGSITIILVIQKTKIKTDNITALEWRSSGHPMYNLIVRRTAKSTGIIMISLKGWLCLAFPGFIICNGLQIAGSDTRLDLLL